MSVGAILVIFQTFLQLRFKFRTIGDLRATTDNTVTSCNQKEDSDDSTISLETYEQTLGELREKVWNRFLIINISRNYLKKNFNTICSMQFVIYLYCWNRRWHLHSFWDVFSSIRYLTSSGCHLDGSLCLELFCCWFCMIAEPLNRYWNALNGRHYYFLPFYLCSWNRWPNLDSSISLEIKRRALFSQWVKNLA